MKDVYFNMNIHYAHRKFLRFMVGPDHYQYRVLPFSLATAPRVFTVVFQVVVAHFKGSGFTIFPFRYSVAEQA